MILRPRRSDPSLKRRQSTDVAERRPNGPNQTDSEVPTKLHPDPERRRETSRSPTRKHRGSSRRARERARDPEGNLLAETLSRRQELRRNADTDTNVSTVYPADSASALDHTVTPARSTSATMSARTPLPFTTHKLVKTRGA
eukprot:4230053-Amphidinium_carterae.2